MKTVVVGLDASERASAVLAQAVDLVSALGGKLFVVRAVGLPVDFPIEALSVEPDALPSKMLGLAQLALDRAIASVPANVLAGAEARLGTAWQVLCDTAKEKSAELLVVGTHGYRGFDHILGTTAARVVNHAPCSVLVVRGGAK